MSLLSDTTFYEAQQEESTLDGDLWTPQTLKVSGATYNYEVTGGEPGTYLLPLSRVVPMGSMVIEVHVNVLRPISSSGFPNYTLGLVSPNDLVPSTALVGVASSATNKNVLATSNVSNLTLTLESPGLTAGVLEFQVTFY